MEKLVKLQQVKTLPCNLNGEEETGSGEGKVDQGTISIAFGRFNPPTVGHKKLLAKVAQEARSSGGEYKEDHYPLKVAGS